MNGFTVMVVIVTESLAVSFFIWLITRCKSLFTGFAAACSGVAICWTVCRYADYIALTIVWGIRFAAVIGIVAFVLGIYPRPKKSGNNLLKNA